MDHLPTRPLARTGAENARKSRYSEEEREYALTVLAFYSGNARRASEALATEGRRVPESTLKYWRSNLYPERYREIEAQEVPKRYARLAEQCEASAERLGSLEEQLADQVEEQASELAPRDAAGALRNVRVSKGSTSTKHRSSAAGRPRSPAPSTSTSSSAPLSSPSAI